MYSRHRLSHHLGTLLPSIFYLGLHRFVRYACNIWDVDPSNKNDEQIALEGIDQLSNFIAELGIPQTSCEMGATEEMLPLIAASANKIGGYHTPTTEEVSSILRACY